MARASSGLGRSEYGLDAQARNGNGADDVSDAAIAEVDVVFARSHTARHAVGFFS